MKSKISILQQELIINHKELSKRTGELTDKSNNMKKLESRQLKYEQEICALKDELKQMIEQNNSINAKFHVSLCFIY